MKSIPIPGSKAGILAQLQKDILPLQGLKLPANGGVLDISWGTMENAFPNRCFPLGAVHEFITTGTEGAAATGGFLACLLSALMQNGGACVWISSSRMLFPTALANFGIAPDRVIFIDLQKERDTAWAMEEALKCAGLSAVVGELYDINFTATRRLQLAVEQSRVTGFIVRPDLHKSSVTACVSRWKITSIPSELDEKMPGVGFPRWKIELLKMRNGHPGTWQMEWSFGKLHPVSVENELLMQEHERKTG